MDDLKIVYLPPEALTPYEGNARKHGAEDLAKYSTTLQKKGTPFSIVLAAAVRR